jgi:hypothetical protein
MVRLYGGGARLIEATLLKRLEDEQAAIARDALTKPSNRDSFEYGKVCGIYAGLERAKQILVSIVNEQDKHEREL